MLPLLAALDASAGVRLLGVSGSHLTEPHQQLSLEQLDLTADTDVAWQRASTTIDEIRERFGNAAIGPTSSLRGGRLKPIRRGAQQWGPDAPPEQTL